MRGESSIWAWIYRAALPGVSILSLVGMGGAAGASCPCGLWPTTALPAVAADPDGEAVELGVKFRSDVSGFITGIRFYKGAANTGTHTATLWRANGQQLAKASFANETAGGWQQVNFAPVAIAANTPYVASYFAPQGHYSLTQSYFADRGFDNAPLHALANSASPNGVYKYGGGFPSATWNSSHYWVDVVFTPTQSGDTAPPLLTAFALPATASTLSVPIAQLAATDNTGVTGYLLSESSSFPRATDNGWSATRPSAYTFKAIGRKTLYAWAKDAAGNVSQGKSASVNIGDATKPTVTAFSIPATANKLVVPINTLTATDNIAVTGFLVNEAPATPPANAVGWSAARPASYAFAAAGRKTLYAWAKDAAGNVSAGKSASVALTLADTVKPTVTAFSLPATAATLTVPIAALAATDNVGVAGYLLSGSSSAPPANATGWTAARPASYAFATAGRKTLYAWAKDAVGNVSAGRSASVTITLPTSGPEPAGWYAGDMHVHRSCGGSPESIASLRDKMTTHDLAAIALLADMGNGEVQNPATDLPLVDGRDSPISTPGRIVHWDAEWHWDATYPQYEHQALGGHLVALGLLDANQIWREYTYPILQWAHQQHAIAGFAHMQYLDEDFPQSLNCCIPVEYPVEVALGAADFISEDVTGGDSAIHAYYRLLNTGFRPGFAAGTDYPCGVSELGSLLTYVQVAGGRMSYADWIEGIARGRTVVSRNGHDEFLDLKVNANATPGDEVPLTGGGNVPVTIRWTAKRNLTGTIQLVRNGGVIASKQASVGPGSPATLSATVAFTKSGWLAARTMNGAGHQSHTAAVFVVVNGAPIRASAADALFYVGWMDSLLEKTSPGGEWSGFFINSRAAAQARYRAAKAVFQRIAEEAAAAK